MLIESSLTHLLSVVKYNEEKEEKAKQEKKERQLEAVELARKLEEEKKKNGTYLHCICTNKHNCTSVEIKTHGLRKSVFMEIKGNHTVLKS